MRTGTQMLERARTTYRGLAIGAAMLTVVAGSGCGQMQRQGTASSYLVVAALQGASGAEPEKFAGSLLSDVITTKDDQTGTYNDLGKVDFQLEMKDATSATGPTSANFITVDRYHVQYIRTDGRNTAGVDVPYPFDSAFTVTVGEKGASGGFTLVRNIAKSEAPLAALRVNGIVLSTIAEVTFYGHDQTGREVSASARIGIDFANFLDPKS